MYQLMPGESLNAGEELISSNGRMRLKMQTDGNLVLYLVEYERPVWASNTYGRPVTRAVMQVDGNFVCYDAAGHAYWATNTYGRPGAYLALQDDGNLVIYHAGRAVWASNTVQYWDRPASRFHLDVQTADESGAGTDANIFLILYGEFGQSSEVRLNPHIRHDAFERNSLESFDVDYLPRLGRIHKIRVRSDMMYLGAAWRLSWIRITPHYPDYPPSTFRLEAWIDNQDPREIAADGWPWFSYAGTRSDSATVRTASHVDLLGSGLPLQQEYTVKYTLENQVEASTEAKTTDKLSVDLKWESPSKIFGQELGKVSADVKSEWEEAVTARQVDKSRWQLEVQDKRTLTFPAERLTIVETDWTEVWDMAVVSLGMTSLAMRWLTTVPANPSWSVRSFAKGDFVPEPFAGYLRRSRPDLVPVFTFPESPVGSIRINNGGSYTNGSSVTLALAATDPTPGSLVTQMRFSDDGKSWTRWEPFRITRSWTLPDGDGPKTVHVQFRNGAGLVSAAASATIVLDTLAPRIMSVSPAAKSATQDPRPTIQATIKDERAELARGRIQLQIDGTAVRSFTYDPTSGRLTYKPRRRMPLGVHAVRLTASDPAGNVRRKQWRFKHLP